MQYAADHIKSDKDVLKIVESNDHLSGVIQQLSNKEFVLEDVKRDGGCL